MRTPGGGCSPDAAADRTPACRCRSGTASSPAAGRPPPAGSAARPRVVAQQLALGELSSGQNTFARFVTRSRSPFGSSMSPSLLRVLERVELLDDERRSSVEASPCGRPASTCACGLVGAAAALSRTRCARAPATARCWRRGAARIFPAAPRSRVLVVAQAEIHRVPQHAVAVHSVNRTCATSSGRTQCAGSLVLNGSANGRLRRSRAASAASDDAIELLLIEAGAGVPDVAQRAGRRRSSPSSSAPKCDRVWRGSVQPPTTNSCCLTSFILRHAGVRRPL